MTSDLERLLVAAVLAGAAILVLVWPREGDQHGWRKASRHPALWVLLSLAVSFAGTALLRGRGVVVLGFLPFLGALWPSPEVPKAEPKVRAAPPPKVMSRAEAFEVFGLTSSTTREEVLEAYSHMMWFAKADHGGSEWLIDKLNEARDVLIKR